VAGEGGIFDIIGPVMVGPSSSHTAGAVRLGSMARNIFGMKPENVEIFLHGSFASTGVGHGTDRALAAGLLGWRPDDVRLVRSLETAKEMGVNIIFKSTDLGDAHPNTVLLYLKKDERYLEIQGSSIGGGKILITRINEFNVELSGAYATLVISHQDRPGAVATVTKILGGHNVNISSMRVSRESRGAKAMMLIEMDELPSYNVVDEIRSNQVVEDALLLQPLTSMGDE